MSKSPDSFTGKGKVIQLSTEGQPHTFTEEDESSIKKVLGWVGMVSRYSAKGNERPGVQEEQNREGPEGRGTPDTKNASRTQTETKASPSPSPKLRMGLHELFLRKYTRAETSENVLDKDDVVDACRPDDKQDSIIFECSAQNSAFGLKFDTKKHEANPYLSMIDNRSDRIADDDVQQRQYLYQDQRSQNLLDGLMSFGESGKKKPKVLSIKKSVTNENKASHQKVSKVEFSPSKAKTFFYTDMSDSCEDFSESHNGSRYDDSISVMTSVGKKMSSFDTVQKPREHRLEIQSTSESLDSPKMDDISIYKLKELYSPVLSVRKVNTKQDTTVNLKACWEREKNSAERINSTPDCIPKHHAQQGRSIFTSPNRVEKPETSGSSLNKDLAELKASSKLKQGSKSVVVGSPLDEADTKSYSRSLCRTHTLDLDESIRFSPVSYPIRSISSVCQDHREQSTSDTMKIPERSRTISPRHIPKVLSSGSYPVKESGMVGSPLSVFPIDINPTEKPHLNDLGHTPRGQTRYPHELSSAEESSSGKNGKLLAERQEQHLLSFSRNASKRNMPYQLASPHSPPCSGRSQAPIDNTNSKQTSQVHSLPFSKGQISVQLITSPKQQRRTTTKRSVEGIKNITSGVLTEQLDDSQGKTSLARSCIHLSCQHHPDLPEFTHISGISAQADKQKWAGVQACEISEHASLFQQSHPESENTFDSSSSISAEVWSLSRTSSACES